MNYRANFEKYSDIKNVELWESQRDADINLIEDIVLGQLKYFDTHCTFLIPSPIILVKFPINSETYYLIDGQHRLRACKVLYEKYKHDVLIPVVFYDCNKKNEVDELYAMINNINSHNCMVEGNKISEDGQKLKVLHVRLKQLYGSKIWHNKKVTKPFVNISLFDEQIRVYLESKTIDEIIEAIQKCNNKYKETLSKSDKETVKNDGGFCLQYKEPKARWVKTLFHE